jgi:hypothetical protein
MNRKEKLLLGLDVRQSSGLEIGPLASPIVRKEEGNVVYVDHADVAVLRDRYKGNAIIDVDKIVEVDAIWGRKTLAECVGTSAPFGYVVASHVVEHVPDLIGWFEELENVLQPRGQVRLAIPGRRYSFDFHRRESGLADVLNARYFRSRAPTVLQVFDYVLNTIEIDIRQAWDGELTGPHSPTEERVKCAMELADDIVKNSSYHDAHCWVFTPQSFVQLMEQLAMFGYLRFRCADLQVTSQYELEFFVALERCESRDEAIASWRDAGQRVRADELALRESIEGRKREEARRESAPSQGAASTDASEAASAPGAGPGGPIAKVRGLVSRACRSRTLRALRDVIRARAHRLLER